MKPILTILLVLALSPAIAAATPGEIMEGGVLREAKLYGFGGDILHLSELRGKPLIINVWASWCDPCRAEMGSLNYLFKRYGGKQFNIIGISTDDDSNAALNFLMRLGIGFANYADNKLMMENMLGADRIPLTLLIDAKGKVLKKVHGYKKWDSPEMLKFIEAIFGTKL